MTTIWHAVVGYFFLLLIVRVLRRRPGAQMTLFDFVFIFLTGGIIILSTAGRDHSVINGVCAAATIGMLHRLMAFLKTKYPKFGAIVDGTPLLLVRNGEWQNEVMEHMWVDDADVMAAARAAGVKTLEQIKYAVLERNGGISVFPKEP